MKSKIITLIKNLKFIFMPSWWLMNEPYNREVDLLMSELLDRFDFTDIGNHTAKLGPIEIWVSNQPYSTMMPYDIHLKYRASRLTIERGIKKLSNQRRELFLQEIRNLHKSI